MLTGLPDAYGRGRIIGDYRRVALYGVDRLTEVKQREKAALDDKWSTDEIIRDREELSEQIRALGELKEMAAKYGFDISGPATTAREAVQWLYFGYLASVKEQNGAAMSLGRVSTFLDVYFERDLANGTLTEEQAQEIVDDFVIKLRIVRFLRTPEYDDLFSGDPTWVTESIAGMLAQLFEQPCLLLAEIIRFHRLFAILENAVRHRLTSLFEIVSLARIISQRPRRARPPSRRHCRYSPSGLNFPARPE